MSYASVEDYNGQPTIMIDGTPFPAMAMTTRMRKPEYLRALGESGIKIYFLMANTNWLRPGGRDEASGFDQFCQEARFLLKEIPDAYIIVRIGMHPPVDWVEAHVKTDVMTYNDGSRKEAILMSEVHMDVLPGMYTLGSHNWREDGQTALKEFIDSLEETEFADRVIGYFLAAGGTSEWYPINPVSDWENNKYADFSPAFLEEYEAILREKYGTEEKLKNAWNRPDASFTNPLIPDLAAREYTRIDEKILDALLNYENADREIGKEIVLNPENEASMGVFLNANQFSYVADFFSAWHRATANTIIHFAKYIKEHSTGKLVGAFYGSYGCTDYYNASTASATLPILDSGYLDFLAAPGVYNNREPGGLVAQREMQDSFRLRGQIFVAEEDSRTHLENDFYRDAMGLYHVTDAIDTLKRDFSRVFLEEIYAWWFDQHEDSGRYMDKDIYALFARQQEIAKQSLTLNRRKNSEIALIYDQESVHYVSVHTNITMLDHYRTSDLHRIGAPVDYYFHDDMAREDMPDYKMYVMLNLFALTDQEREAIHKKAAKNKAVVIWLYGAGLINPEQEEKMSPEYIQQLTGICVKMTTETTSSRFKIQPHPALQYGDVHRRYGYIDRDVHSNVWLGSELKAPFANPFFYIDDPEVEVLGRYLINDKVAFGLKETNGFTSIYCGAHILRSELLASIAAYAGVHLYTTSDDCLYANRNYVTIHANGSGERTLFFKEPCSPFEEYEQRYYGKNLGSLTVDMRHGQTLLFRITELPQENRL